MDAARIQQKVTYGYARAARYLGLLADWYRPTPLACIDPSTKLGALQMYADPKPDFQAKVPSSYPNAQWYLAVDRTRLQAGDYLVIPATPGSSGDTYFVNMLQAFSPTGGVQCNARATFFRPGGDQRPGAGYYAGNPRGHGEPLLRDVPLSLLAGTKGEADKTGVVNETRQPWAAILLPCIGGVQLRVADLMLVSETAEGGLRGGTGRRYVLSSVEHTDLGIRATAAYSGA